MSKKSNKKSKNIITHTGIIHGQNSIYINKVKSYDGKRSDKRTCIFYNKDTMKCTNEKCHTVICTTAYNCTLYKRKLKNNDLLLYDESYIQQPYKSSTHETNNSYIGISKNIGTPMHVGYLKKKSKEKRRHKVRCIYYDKVEKLCKWFMFKCIGSSRCNKYHEK